MLVETHTLLDAANADGYALGAFNIYNLEGVRAVLNAAEKTSSPVMLQLHPAAINYGGAALVAGCLAAAKATSMPVAVHLDHSDALVAIEAALAAGILSLMADGSQLSYADNVAFTAAAAQLAHQRSASIEGELGRLSGSEDGLSVADYEAHLTDPEQAADFVERTGIDALAVCIGNVHGHYRSAPQLDFERLEAIKRVVDVPLVLHGASGLPPEQIQRAISLGVRKFNVNTEVRSAFVGALRARFAAHDAPDLLDLMRDAIAAMEAVIIDKIQLFGSAGRV